MRTSEITLDEITCPNGGSFSPARVVPKKQKNVSGTCLNGLERPSGMEGKTSRAEAHDDYYRVLLYLNERWRIITCKDNKQWILQYKRSLKQPNNWRGVSFCVSRYGLNRAIKEKVRNNSTGLGIEGNEWKTNGLTDLMSSLREALTDMLPEFIWESNNTNE